ncbi:MAG: flippase-like domain-containing protein [Bacteroidales bacterium]|nr:flippase-like domain-containing protein [Bacteroidales bacterium]
MTKERIKKILNFIFKLLITVLAIYIVIRKIDLTELWSYIKDVNLLYLFIALITLGISKIIEAFRLNIFFRAKNVILDEIQNLKLYLLGMFYNLFLPGGIGGDGYKVYWLKKNQGAKLKSVIWASILNRVNGLYGLIILICISVFFISFDFKYNNYLVLLIPVFYAVYYFVLKIFFKDYTSTLPKTTVQSIIIQFLQVLSAHFILVSLGLDSAYHDYWFLFFISGIIFAIPVTLGGFGSRELVFVYASQFLMVDVNLAVALGLLTYVIRAILSFSGVYFIAFPSKLNDLNSAS